MSHRQKEEWLVGVQLFLSSRLRTPAYSQAAASNRMIQTPSMVPNTQYLLDGVVWALHDHPEWAPEAWLVVYSHLRDASDRYQETARQLTTAKGAEEGNSQSRVFREKMYKAHACVQDVYLAFCVMDAFMKHIVSGVDTKLVSAVFSDVPRIVSDHCPLLDNSDSTWVSDALEEYRFLFLNILESWVSMRSLPADFNRRLEEHIRHRLKLNRDAKGERVAASSSARQGMRALMSTIASATAGTAAALSSSTSAGASPLKLTAADSEGLVRSFITSIFPPRRSAVGRTMCTHCGAPLKDEASRNTHYRAHFNGHNFMQSETKVVRLMYPSMADFVENVGDANKEGHYPYVVQVLEDAYRNGERGIVRVRRQADGAAKE